MLGFDIRFGMFRRVLLLGPWAIKIPRLKRFKRGRWSNLWERELWKQRAHPALCPVIAADPFGLFVVMPRARDISDAEFEDWWAGGALALSEPGQPKVPQMFEEKPEDAGVLPCGRRVMVDYGIRGDISPPP